MCLRLSSDVIPSGISTKITYKFLIYFLRATCPQLNLPEIRDLSCVEVSATALIYGSVKCSIKFCRLKLFIISNTESITLREIYLS